VLLKLTGHLTAAKTRLDVATQDRVYGQAVVGVRLKSKGGHEGREIGGRFRFTTCMSSFVGLCECVAVHLTRVAQG
jgi:hypothetical protein